MTPSVKGRNSKKQSEDQISERLVQVPAGHHYLILYSNMNKMRNVYSKYVKEQMEAEPESVIIILPFYDNTEKVRWLLESNGISVKEYELQGTLIIIDIVKVIGNEYYEVSDVERLRAFTKQVLSQYETKTIFVVADMSVFQHLGRASELLDYERTLHKDLKMERWKELCFYNETDFEIMFTQEQANELLEYHKDKLITI